MPIEHTITENEMNDILEEAKARCFEEYGKYITPPKWLLTFVLYHDSEMNLKQTEVAQILQINQATVSRNYKRALDMLPTPIDPPKKGAYQEPPKDTEQ